MNKKCVACSKYTFIVRESVGVFKNYGTNTILKLDKFLSKYNDCTKIDILFQIEVHKSFKFIRNLKYLKCLN